MTTNNNKHIFTNEIVYIRQLFFKNVTFLSSNELSVVFNILSSHANTNLPNRRFLREQFLISKHSLILHALLYSQPHIPGFYI